MGPYVNQKLIQEGEVKFKKAYHWVILITCCIILLSTSITGCSKPYVDKKYTQEQIKIERIQYAKVDRANVLSIWAQELDLGNTSVKRFESVARFLKLDDMEKELEMKIHSPPERYFNRTRPVILFFHGGAFVKGNLENPSMKLLCSEFAERGYVTISVQYRKMNFLTPSFVKAGYVATQDARAAIRYVVNHSDELGIDPKNIFLAGVSAGACTVLNAAFIDEGEDMEQRSEKLIKMYGDLDAIGEQTDKDYIIKGVLNIAGAIGSLDWMNNNKIPIINFYGSNDNIIPKNCGIPFPQQGKVYDGFIKRIKSLFRNNKKIKNIFSDASLFEVCASPEIDLRSKKIGIPVQTVRYENADHSFMISQNGTMTKEGKETVNKTALFFKKAL